MVALPSSLLKYSGQILDCDSHEMAPLQAWVEMYGPEAQPFCDVFAAFPGTEETDRNCANLPDYGGDVLEVGPNILEVKGCRAPGARDPGRRIAVLDALGLSRQLIFPTQFAIHAAKLLMLHDRSDFLPSISGDRRAYARTLLSRYNDWAAEVAGTSNRLRPVGQLYGDSPQEVIGIARDLIVRGIRALQLPSGDLVGGLSPGHPDLDELWSILQEANCPLLLHIGQEGQFFETRGWGEVPAFSTYRTTSEFKTDPWSLATIHLSYQNFLTALIVTGVFDRFPLLRLGVAEVGAYWIGHLIESLDYWHVQSKKLVRSPGAYTLPNPPSDYIRRNLRVIPFLFDDVRGLIERYDLQDTFCFSTDYPHIEGGKDPFGTFYEALAPLGEEIVHKFFVRNGLFILPD